MRYLLFFILFSFFQFSNAQLLSGKEKNYTRKDSLRGSLRPERTDYDVKKYDLFVKVDPEKKYISGVNKISFKTSAKLPKLQIDLFENMKIDSILFRGKKLKFNREFNAVLLNLKKRSRRIKSERSTFIILVIL